MQNHHVRFSFHRNGHINSLLDNYPVRACTPRGRVIVLSVGRSVCLSVCLSVCTKSGL